MGKGGRGVLWYPYPIWGAANAHGWRGNNLRTAPCLVANTCGALATLSEATLHPAIAANRSTTGLTPNEPLQGATIRKQ